MSNRERIPPPEKSFGVGSQFNPHRTEPWASRFRNAVDTMRNRSQTDIALRRSERAKLHEMNRGAKRRSIR